MLDLSDIESSLVDDRMKGMPGEIGRQGWNLPREDLSLPLAVLSERWRIMATGWCIMATGCAACPGYHRRFGAIAPVGPPRSCARVTRVYVFQELTRDPSFDPCQVISVVNYNYNIVSAIPCVLLTAQE